MERDGYDLSEVDPELAEFLEFAEEADVAGVVLHLPNEAVADREAGMEDSALDGVLGSPEELLIKLRGDPDVGGSLDL